MPFSSDNADNPRLITLFGREIWKALNLLILTCSLQKSHDLDTVQ